MAAALGCGYKATVEANETTSTGLLTSRSEPRRFDTDGGIAGAVLVAITSANAADLGRPVYTAPPDSSARSAATSVGAGENLGARRCTGRAEQNTYAYCAADSLVTFSHFYMPIGLVGPAETAGQAVVRLSAPVDRTPGPSASGKWHLEGDFMTESLMYLAIGFLAAVLIVGALSLLVVIPLVHGRAVRLTTRRLEAAMPQSMVQIKADKDLLRAEFAISTRRLEQKIEKLETRNAGQLVELSKKGEAIKHLGLNVHALRKQLRATEEELAVAHEVGRGLSDKESELAKLRSALDERSALVDSQKAENTALATQVHTLQGQLTQAGEKANAAEERRDAAVRDLSEKESRLAGLISTLNERSALADSQKTEIAALTMEVQTLQRQLAQAGEETKAAEDRRDAALRDLSEKESKLVGLISTLNERSALADSQKTEIAALTMEVQTLQRQLARAGEKAKAAEDRRDAAMRDLSQKESAIVQLTTALNERSVLVDSHKAENAALRMQARMLNERLIQAGKEARAVAECRDAERRELKAAAQNLMEERSRFENFHRRVTELVQQVTAQRTEDQVLHWRVREEMENRLIEQSRFLNESESELIHLRHEIEIARKAEDDLRVAMIEIDGRANAATQDLIAEKAKLQAALDRANGDRARLVHELANLKRQADQARAAERVDSAALPERVNDIAAERARRAAYGGLSRRANS
jgi:hypothetical protein